MKSLSAYLAYRQPQLAQAMRDQLGPRCAQVDNGSQPSLPPIAQWNLRQEQNGYFSGGWNFGMSYLTELAEAIWMCNSDVQGVSSLLLDHLTQALAADDWLAAVTPVFNSPHTLFHQPGPVRWIDWTCPVVRSQAWREVGPFDSARFPGYGADLDWCRRAREAGWRFAVVNETIHHLGSQTALAEGLQGLQGDVHAMTLALQEKWGVQTWQEMT